MNIYELSCIQIILVNIRLVPRIRLDIHTSMYLCRLYIVTTMTWPDEVLVVQWDTGCLQRVRGISKLDLKKFKPRNSVLVKVQTKFWKIMYQRLCSLSRCWHSFNQKRRLAATFLWNWRPFLRGYFAIAVEFICTISAVKEPKNSLFLMLSPWVRLRIDWDGFSRSLTLTFSVDCWVQSAGDM